jgi:hypothetical protein
MKLFISLLYFCTFLCSTAIASKDFSEKLIISTGTNLTQEEETLLKLKIYFIENPILRRLEDEYHLTTSMEKIENYHMVVIKPLDSLDIRNQLLLVLTPIFPNLTFVDNIIHTPPIMQASQAENSVHTTQKGKKRKQISLFDDLALQWVAIWLLAVIGLLLSLWNRRKLSKLKNTQKDISANQHKIEKEIKHLGAQNV